MNFPKSTRYINHFLLLDAMEKRWEIKALPDEAKATELAKQLNINVRIAQLLLQRGIRTFEEAKLFFRPELTHLHDPFLMADMHKAVDRLSMAIANNEKILVYGDYDVDGTTAVALMYRFLKGFTSHLAYYIPDRYAEGYGISTIGIDYATEHNFNLIIALDCGIKSQAKIDYANSLGIDFIICDHHRPDETLPNAIAVLDPKRTDCPYPYKELSGCGIGFKLAQAFLIQQDGDMEQLYNLMELCAISIACDIVPISGENRVLAAFGLKRIHNNPVPGIATLIELSGAKPESMDISDLVFKIGPRINAAGRIGHGSMAVELMVTDQPEDSLKHGDSINDHNVVRKEIDEETTAQALAMIEGDSWIMAAKSTVLYNPDWHKGVIGIVASRVIEKYYRPTILLTESHGMAAGSARSVRGFDVYDAIEACSDLLEQFGGHTYAAGLSLKTENIAAFREKFDAIVSATITPEQLIPSSVADLEIELTDIYSKFYSIIKQMAPFGPANLNPVFVIKNVRNGGNSRRVGADLSHLKIDLVNADNSARIGGIGFQLGHKAELVLSGQPFDVMCQIDENEFRGNVELQLKIKDIRATELK